MRNNIFSWHVCCKPGKIMLKMQAESTHSLIFFVNRHIGNIGTERKWKWRMIHYFKHHLSKLNPRSRAILDFITKNRCLMNKAACKHCHGKLYYDFNPTTPKGRSHSTPQTVKHWGWQKKATWCFTCQSSTETSLYSDWGSWKSVTVTSFLHNPAKQPWITIVILWHDA